jgi:ketosteroid isomerase-like protein
MHFNNNLEQRQRNELSGTRTDGEQTDLRATFGLRKLNGVWLITHEHYSVRGLKPQ